MYTGQCHTVPFKVGSLGPHAVLPVTINCPIIFPRISSMVWNQFLFKGDFSFAKTRNSRVPNLGYRGAESPGWSDVSPRALHKMWCTSGHVVVRKLPIRLSRAVAFWIIWVVSAEECWSLMQNLIQIRCSTHSVILNTTATQCTCSLNSIYHPHWLVQWNHHCSCTHIPVHSLRLPEYI